MEWLGLHITPKDELHPVQKLMDPEEEKEAL
jgi:hypothetical protein